jgi:hypothetical protein
MKVQFQLDVPVPELVELGWSKYRILKDIDKALTALPNDLFFEPTTGTLMLKPSVMKDGYEYDSAHDADKVGLTQFNAAVGKWEERPGPEGTFVAGYTPAPWVSSTHGFTLVDTLSLVSLNAVKAALLNSVGREIVPVLETNDSWPANSPLYVRYFHYGPHSVHPADVLSIMFGDFFLTMNAAGICELWWAKDGDRAGEWVKRKVFGSVGAKRDKGLDSITTFGAGSMQYGAILILPMGRGHIYFRIMTPWGGVFNGIYTHPEATADAQWKYSITQAGKVIICTSKSFQRQLHLQLAKVKYPTTATWTDETFQLTYPPTTVPEHNLYNCSTGGVVAVAKVLEDGSGATWTTGDKVASKMTFTGDGEWTPFLDGYSVTFNPKFETGEQTPITLEATELNRVQIEVGESLDDQRLKVEVKDSSLLDSIRERGEIVGQLLIDDSPYMLCQFVEPEVELRKTGDVYTYEGQNFGAYRLNEKRFLWPPTFGNMYHAEAVDYALKLCGFPTTVRDADGIKLPETEAKGAKEGSDKTILKSQPEFNSLVREFIDYVVETFSRWDLRYKADQKWYYKHKVVPTEPAYTFSKFSSTNNPFTRGSVARRVTKKILPPEANLVIVFGQDDHGNPLGAFRYDEPSHTGLPEKPLNYVGRLKVVVIIDAALNTPVILNHVADLMYAELRRRIVQVCWDGNFIPSLETGMGVQVEGVGLVQVRSFAGEAETLKLFTTTPCIHYTGELVE